MPVSGRNLLVLVWVLTLAALVTSQITFSRDWSGGKRAEPVELDCGQFARLCRHFVHEMKSSLAGRLPDSGAKHRHPLEETPPIYEDE
ncbi:uncharacterized protein LOC126376739 isoform X2 [Pectinophora gossypiella]|uniref:uncharacterized protein LOC126376739 isoform X2 n=1 Tax=Pectinophora gossypiella TaxID=13191 RepID=UPI00214EB3ED|nr:uncharacterized protein LOC126376739 isoform X2 [Pectinophora gossypiella]